jgi:hypothetical protein
VKLEGLADALSTRRWRDTKRFNVTLSQPLTVTKDGWAAAIGSDPLHQVSKKADAVVAAKRAKQDGGLRVR